MSEAFLQMIGIRKSFGGVEALKGVDFNVQPGEVHALCGENGAGKSTLMNIIAGVQRPDAGEIRLGGKLVAFANAQAAQRAGISIVFQERSLFGPLTVAENIFAGRQQAHVLGFINRRKLFEDADRLLKEVAPNVSAHDTVQDLSPAQQQMVEIAKALSFDAKVVIFDEPTAALTDSETDRLFAVIRELRERGAGIVYISHRLEEIFEIGDRVTVLKDGTWQGTLKVSDASQDELIRRMVGRDLEKAEPALLQPGSPILLDVKGLSDDVLLKNISFHARAGEIVSLAGLAGAGRTETALALFGVRPRTSGEILLVGMKVDIRSPQAAIAHGLGYVSEDRKESGLFLEMSVEMNISAARLRQFGEWFFRDKAESQVANEFRDKLRIACRDVGQETAELSGGNQQKVLLARWLLVNPKVLIVDEPTRGVDVGAKAEVHQLLRQFASQGNAVIVISSELPEVLMVSDRIYVLRAGRITGELKREDASEEAIMRLAAGEAPS